MKIQEWLTANRQGNAATKATAHPVCQKLGTPVGCVISQCH